MDTTRCALVAFCLTAFALGCDDPKPPSIPQPEPLKPPPAAVAPPAPVRETVALHWNPSIASGRGLLIDVTTDPKHRSVHLVNAHDDGHRSFDVQMPLHVSLYAAFGAALNTDQRRVALISQDSGLSTTKVKAHGAGKLRRTVGSKDPVTFVISETGIPMSELDSQTLQMVGPVMQLAPTAVGVGDSWPLTSGQFEIHDEDWIEKRHDVSTHAKLTAIRHTPDGTFADIEIEGDETLEGEFNIDSIVRRKNTHSVMSQSLRGHGTFAVEAGTWQRLELTSTMKMSGLSKADVLMSSVITPVALPAKVQSQAAGALKATGK